MFNPQKTYIFEFSIPMFWGHRCEHVDDAHSKFRLGRLSLLCAGREWQKHWLLHLFVVWSWLFWFLVVLAAWNTYKNLGMLITNNHAHSTIMTQDLNNNNETQSHYYTPTITNTITTKHHNNLQYQLGLESVSGFLTL